MSDPRIEAIFLPLCRLVGLTWIASGFITFLYVPQYLPYFDEGTQTIYKVQTLLVIFAGICEVGLGYVLTAHSGGVYRLLALGPSTGRRGMVRCCACPSSAEANLVRDLLVQRGIRVMTVDEGPSVSLAGAELYAYVDVLESDLEEARRILRDHGYGRFLIRGGERRRGFAGGKCRVVSIAGVAGHRCAGAE